MILLDDLDESIEWSKVEYEKDADTSLALDLSRPVFGSPGNPAWKK